MNSEKEYETLCTMYGDSMLSEGWYVMECWGSDTPYQLQKFDDPEEVSKQNSIDIPHLSTDKEAWLIVACGNKPHHKAALDFLKGYSPKEYYNILLECKGVQE